MKVFLHKNFVKSLKKLRKKEQDKTRQQIKLFIISPFNPILNNHPLKGKYTNFRSIDITGDLRALYKFIDDERCVFVVIDTHSNLYS